MPPLWRRLSLLFCTCVPTRWQYFRSTLHLYASSIVDQVTQFQRFLAPKPQGARWNSSDSLFAFWIGINDVVRILLRSLDRLLGLRFVANTGKFIRLGVFRVMSVQASS